MQPSGGIKNSVWGEFRGKRKKPPYFKQIRRFSWRRRRDLNPRAGYPAYSLSRGAPSASWVLLQVENKKTDWIVWRREWDSNPRKLALRWFSRPVPSTARPSLPVLFPASRPDAGYMLPQIAVLVNYLFRPAGKRPGGASEKFFAFFYFSSCFFISCMLLYQG